MTIDKSCMYGISFHTPILFLIFNRPDTTERVFEKIREIKPKYLFVSADGPRMNKAGEAELCEKARKVVLDSIDWDCELKTRFLDENFGCRKAVSSGIDWFFQNVEEGIILEDDCLPDLSFFPFCQALLEYYRNNEKIMHIGGANFQDGNTRGDGSYYFSNINHIWGWATWKRAWKLYDVEMKSYPDFLRTNKIEELIPNSAFRNYWKRNFDVVYGNKKDTWDIQWQYAVTFNKGLAIIPNKNLISNIGFSQNATHTVDYFHSLANRRTESIDKIIHPSSMEILNEADIYTLKKYLSPPKWKKLYMLLAGYIQK